MSTHGKQIMQAVTLILEGEHNIEVKEQVCVPFSFLRNVFWVWVPRGIVVRNLLSLLCCKRLCWVQKCYRHGKGLKEKTLSHPWNSSRILPPGMEEDMTRVYSFTFCVMHYTYCLSLWGMDTSDHLRVNPFPRIHISSPPYHYALNQIPAASWWKTPYAGDIFYFLTLLHPSSLFLSHTPSFCCVSIGQV